MINKKNSSSEHDSLNPSTTPKEELQAPLTSDELRTKQRVSDALDATSSGKKLDEYFGITSGIPDQSEGEARESSKLMQELREVTSTGNTTDLADLLSKIAEHTNNSGADPDALRELIKGARRPKES